MMNHVLAIAAALTLTSAAGAFAAENTFSASLASPVAKTKIVAGGAVWNCEGETCVAGAITTETSSLRACKALAKEVGPLAAYGGRAAFEADKLAKCNTVAKAPAAISQTAVAAN
jgi:hypothetical protein